MEVMDVIVNELVDTSAHAHSWLPLLSLEGSQPVTHWSIIINTTGVPVRVTRHTHHIDSRRDLLTLLEEHNNFLRPPPITNSEVNKGTIAVLQPTTNPLPTHVVCLPA